MERIHAHPLQMDALQQLHGMMESLMGAKVALVMVDEHGAIGMMKNTEISHEQLRAVVTELTATASPLRMTTEGELIDKRKVQ